MGGLRLDPARREVSAGNDAAVPLTALELRLLYLLMSHPGQVLRYDLLVPRVWGPDAGHRWSGNWDPRDPIATDYDRS